MYGPALWRSLRSAGRCRRLASSLSDPPVCRGYMAGMSVAPGADMEGTSFDEAFDLLGLIDQELLQEYEKDLWELDKRKIIFGTKRVSVIDCVTEAGECARLLLHNTEPHMAQTAIRIDEVGALTPPFPAMSSLRGQFGMHLGGLALAVALWRTAKLNGVNLSHQADDAAQPQVLVLGGGGGVIPRTIAAAMPGALIDVVEPCADTRLAARTWFGLAELEKSPDKFKLHGGCGVKHLERVSEGSVDVLIIDASSSEHDGIYAPPPPFRLDSFWAAAIRAMNPAGAAFGVNLVGSPEATAALQHRIAKATKGWSLRCIPPPPGGLPDAVLLDQRLLFGLLGRFADETELREVGLVGLGGRLINDEELWLPQWHKYPDLQAPSGQ